MRPYSSASGSLTLSTISAESHTSSTPAREAPAATYRSSGKEEPTPAPRSITTWWPRPTSSRAPAGVNATRYSSGLISVTTPIFIATSLSITPGARTRRAYIPPLVDRRRRPALVWRREFPGTYALKCLAAAALGAGVMALAFVVPGIPHRWSGVAAVAFLLFGLADVAYDLVNEERRPRTTNLPLALVIAVGLAAAGLVLSWLLQTTAPLAASGTILVDVGVAGLLALAIGRTVAEPLPGGSGA